MGLLLMRNGGSGDGCPEGLTGELKVETKELEIRVVPSVSEYQVP